MSDRSVNWRWKPSRHAEGHPPPPRHTIDSSSRNNSAENARRMVAAPAAKDADDEDPEGEYLVVESDGSDDTEFHESALHKAKVLGACDIMEKGTLYVEKGSIYGAVILMPQLARSMDWPRILTVPAIRSYLFFALDILLQSLILMMLAKHETVNNTFAGQMFLCDLGAGCSDIHANAGKTCTGPGGTNITPPRLYSYDIWSTRSFIKQSMQTIFPDKASEIGEKIDPGEYGLESYWCRWLCTFLFMMTMMQELSNIIDMGQLLYYIPTKAESWVDIKDKDVKNTHSTEGKTEHHEEEEHEWWEKVDLKIAGMPLGWKIGSVVGVLLPKILVWKLTAQTGAMFLMETAAIDDLIVNSVALTFILAISEMVCQTLTSETTHEMLHRCKDYPLYKVDELGRMKDEDIVKEFGKPEYMKRVGVVDVILALLPLKLIGVTVMTCYVVLEYYRRHCDVSHWWEFRFLPTPLHLATSTSFSVLNSFFPNFFPIEVQTTPEWSMPDLVS